jgi:hypothetical protein
MIISILPSPVDEACEFDALSKSVNIMKPHSVNAIPSGNADHQMRSRHVTT